MILKLCRDVPMISLRVLKRGCDVQQLMDTGVELHIYKPACCVPPRTRLIKNGCTWERIPLAPPIPDVIYPAFELDDEGRITFWFDDKLWNLPSGRYHGLIVCGRSRIANPIDIDLCTDDAYIAEVATPSAASCGDSLC